MNVFSGSRRIALALAALWVAGCVAYAVFDEAIVRVYYSAPWPNESAVPVSGCAPNDATRFRSHTTAQGTSTSLWFCFPPARFDAGRTIYAFEIEADGKRFRGGDQFSSEFMDYSRQRADSFRITPEIEAKLDSMRPAARLAIVKQAAIVAASGLAVGWILVAGIGWIARGFMGVPRGKDFRE